MFAITLNAGRGEHAHTGVDTDAAVTFFACRWLRNGRWRTDKMLPSRGASTAS